MKPVSTIKSKILPIPINDIDTDQIIPAIYLKVINKDGLVDGLFTRWRYLEDGSLNPEFAMNKEIHKGATVILAGENFGTGSSREHAPWALTGYGIQAIISTSFADIFRNNALKNSLLPIIVDEETQQQLFSLVEEDPTVEISVDLESQVLTLPDGREVEFPLDPFSKTCMMEGVDQLGYVLGMTDTIEAFEAKTGR